jgi:glutamine---fructose-6-phosphate transaminase (isomerizing)
MCGIWGLVSIDHELNPKTVGGMVRKLMVLSESRGKEAAGIAIANRNGASVFRRASAASKMITTPEFHSFWKRSFDVSEGSFAAIGHSRLVTNGAAMHPDNNQPVVGKGLVTVHNGIIVNVEELWKQHPELTCRTQVDTEVFVALMEAYQKTEPLDIAVRKVFQEIFGMASTLNLFADSGRFVAATNNGSLYRVMSGSGKTVVFASESLTLDRLIRSCGGEIKQLFSGSEVKQLRAGDALMLSLSGMEPTEFRLDGEAAVSAAPGETHEVKINIDQDKDVLVQSPYEHPFVAAQHYKEFEINTEPIRSIRRCTRCVMPETMPFIEFDDEGVCNYCRTYQKHPLLGRDALRKWADGARRHDSKADAIVAFSGGRDSSYGLHYFVRELGLHPVAFTYDWGMVTDLARRNQSRMCAELGVELVLVSADIRKKRAYIQKNVSAWLKKPDLGLVPLFMAGDKQYFYYANKTRKQYGIEEVLLATNPYEKTHFKFGFCGAKPVILRGKDQGALESLNPSGIARMAGHYLKQYALNPSYINSSLWDSIGATISFYMIPHQYFRLYDYIPWVESVVDDTLIHQYGWETSPDCQSTWRIGDGTAPFYNYIYYLVAGFTENDTLRSNQIREGMLTRDEALRLVERDNQPRFDSMQWYFDTIGLSMEDALRIIQKIPRLYGK